MSQHHHYDPLAHKGHSVELIREVIDIKAKRRYQIIWCETCCDCCTCSDECITNRCDHEMIQEYAT